MESKCVNRCSQSINSSQGDGAMCVIALVHSSSRAFQRLHKGGKEGRREEAEKKNGKSNRRWRNESIWYWSIQKVPLIWAECREAQLHRYYHIIIIMYIYMSWDLTGYPVFCKLFIHLTGFSPKRLTVAAASNLYVDCRPAAYISVASGRTWHTSWQYESK